MAKEVTGPGRRSGLVAASVSGDVYPWPMWMLVPGAALGAVTVGVQAIRHQKRHELATRPAADSPGQPPR